MNKRKKINTLNKLIFVIAVFALFVEELIEFFSPYSSFLLVILDRSFKFSRGNFLMVIHLFF